MEVLKDHCVELMSIEVTTDHSEILEPESEAPSVMASTTKTFWDMATNYSSADKSVPKVMKVGNGPAKSTDFTQMLAVLVLILSFIMGLVFYVIGK
ncbi:hypothetical protein CDL12_30111 [Handroanthus impetiginosus]|uniref:Uncharacterized protein n=1 Tax=Handroanthus impetiginosus TaxID=429701 RepID=A0A2G9FXL0_9LAMI|nr:hypothetical protein CDL12_30111 [Handroanthus impetiginosus]